jgi:hypothetical protein
VQSQSQTQHELVFKNQPPLPGGLPKKNFWEFDTWLFGNYLIYYSVGGSGEGPLKVFDIKNRSYGEPVSIT